MIEISNLSKRYGELTAVDDITFSVGAGEVLGFLGPNGAGKSTTMKLITRSPRADVRAALAVCGQMCSPRRSQPGVHGLLPRARPATAKCRCGAFLDFIADVRRLTGDRRRARLDDVIARLGLASVLGKSSNALERLQRRVGLSQALVHDPRSCSRRAHRRARPGTRSTRFAS